MQAHDKPLRVLLVEDNAGDARLIREILVEARPWPALELVHAERLSAGLSHLASDGVNVVLLDLGLPDSQGLETFLSVHACAPHVPVVVLTGLNDEAVALRALHEGAQDYLVKAGLESDQLPRAVRYAIERKQAEQALRRTVAELEAKTSELESFTYSVSHDLKEPLRTMEAFSQFLLEDYAERLDEQGRDYLERMGRAGARLRQMIEELLVLARVGQRSQEAVRVDVRELVNNIVSAMQVAVDEKGLHVELESGLPAVAGDLYHTEQIFGNLFSNALKFNHAAEPLVRIGVRSVEDGRATFYVQDNGIGVEPEYHERIFQVFQQLHRREEYEGTGAGLAIVKRAAEALGGSVRLESSLGAGATFLVQLPVWESGSAASETKAA